MKGTNHLIAGTCTAGCLVVSAVIQQEAGIIPIAGMGAAALVGSLFPDIDSRTSKLGKKMKIASWMASKFFGHRGFLHSPLFVGLAYLLCFVLFRHYNITEYSYIYGGFITGMLMHLACDMTTKGGIPLLYPWDKGKVSLGVLSSGSKWEWISLIFVVLLAVGATVLMLHNEIYLSALLFQ